MLVFCSKCQTQLAPDVKTCACGGEPFAIFAPGEKVPEQIVGKGRQGSEASPPDGVPPPQEPLRGRDVGAMLGAYFFPRHADTAGKLGYLLGRAIEGQPLVSFRASPELPHRRLDIGAPSFGKKAKTKSGKPRKRKRKS